MNQSMTGQFFPSISVAHQLSRFTYSKAVSLAGSRRNRFAITFMTNAVADCETKRRFYWPHDRAVRPDGGYLRISGSARRCRVVGIVNGPATRGVALHR